MLKKLKQLLKEYEAELLTALEKDLGKNNFEAFASEIGTCYKEISYTLKHLKSWVKPKKVSTSILNFPSTGKIVFEPYGNTLIISPWNYPLYLAISPLVGAIAAGNTAILKTSELAPHTSKVIEEMINKNFDQSFLFVMEGGVQETTELLKLQFNHIFFTGSTAVGKIIMKAAADHLASVTLELGGKSPCIIDKEMPLDMSVKRILWGKFFNTGQTCVAPDYIYIHETKLSEFIKLSKKYLKIFYTDNPKQSPDYGRIINTRHFDRLIGLLDEKKIVIGGDHDRENKYLSPTLMTDITWNDPVMKEEIFGPILPILTYKNLSEVIEKVNAHDKPLALYFFSKNKAHKKMIEDHCSFGGGCINDTIIHLTEDQLPFGGVGPSGVGSYHGQQSFLTFSHEKSILHRETWYDNPIRYAPYKGKMKFLRWIFR